MFIFVFRTGPALTRLLRDRFESRMGRGRKCHTSLSLPLLPPFVGSFWAATASLTTPSQAQEPDLQSQPASSCPTGNRCRAIALTPQADAPPDPRPRSRIPHSMGSSPDTALVTDTLSASFRHVDTQSTIRRRCHRSRAKGAHSRVGRSLLYPAERRSNKDLKAMAFISGDGTTPPATTSPTSRMTHA
jgi:hypothetical protein